VAKEQLCAKSTAADAKIEHAIGPSLVIGCGIEAFHANMLKSGQIRIISSCNLKKALRPSPYSIGMLTSKIPG
jgi:hypothetical protein